MFSRPFHLNMIRFQLFLSRSPKTSLHNSIIFAIRAHELYPKFSQLLQTAYQLRNMNICQVSFVKCLVAKMLFIASYLRSPYRVQFFYSSTASFSPTSNCILAVAISLDLHFVQDKHPLTVFYEWLAL